MNRKVQRVTSLFLFRNLKLELKEGGRWKGKIERKRQGKRVNMSRKKKD